MPLPRPAATPAPDASDVSVLGPGTRVRGRVEGDGNLRVEGRVEGDVAVSGELVLEDGAGVSGNVEAASVTLGGELAGDVASRGGVLVRATAKVHGNLAGAEIAIEEGAVFTGRIEIEFDLPAELGGRQGGAR